MGSPRLFVVVHPKFQTRQHTFSTLTSPSSRFANSYTLLFAPMIRTYDFLAPSLHPNTLLDISIPEPGPSTLEPVVKHLPIKHNEYAAVGTIKRLHQTQDGSVGSLVPAPDPANGSTSSRTTRSG